MQIHDVLPGDPGQVTLAGLARAMSQQAILEPAAMRLASLCLTVDETVYQRPQANAETCRLATLRIKEAGVEFNQVGGIRGMRLMLDLASAIYPEAAGTLDRMWDGIGQWRASPKPAGPGSA